MQGTLKDAIQYASQNPTSDFAVKLATQVKSGQFDGQAQQMGINLAPIKQSSIGKSPVAPVQAPEDGILGGKSSTEKVIRPIADNIVNPIADRLATGIVNTGKALYNRAKNLLTDTSNAGAADAGKPVIDKALGTSAFTAEKFISTTAGGVGDIFANMISPFIPQSVKDAYGPEIEKAITDIKASADEVGLSQAVAKASAEHPILKTAINDAMNIFSLAVPESAASKVAPLVERGVNATADAAAGAVRTGADAAAQAAKASTDAAAARATAASAKTFANSIDEAKSVLNPSDYYTPTEKSLALKNKNIEIKGKGPFKKEVVNPVTTRQTETIASLIDEGKAKVASGEAAQTDVLSTKNLPSQNISVLDREARIADSGIDELVNRPDLNKPFTQNALNKTFDNVLGSAKDNLVFVPDTTEAKAYQQVIDVAKEEIARQSYNSAGLRKGIKAFNARMEAVLDKNIYAESSESVGNARLQAAKDVRTELNNFLADNLESPTIKKSALANENVGAKLPAKSTFDYGNVEGGAKYKADLQREAQLLNAKDEIAYRASRSIDKTKLEQYLKTHPGAKQALKYGTVAVGGTLIGGGVLKELGL